MISHLSLEDLRLLLPVVSQIYQETYQGQVNLEAFHTFWSLILQEEMGQILVIHKREIIQGYLGWVYSDNMFTGEREIDVLFLYVYPHFRGGAKMNHLFDTVESLGLPVNYYPMGLEASQFLKGRGYEPQQTIWRKP